MFISDRENTCSSCKTSTVRAWPIIFKFRCFINKLLASKSHLKIGGKTTNINVVIREEAPAVVLGSRSDGLIADDSPTRSILKMPP